MVTLDALWLPILVATVLVFAASSLVWMVLPHHRSDVKGLADEAAVMEAIGKQALAPGLYNFPHAATPKEMGHPAFQEKMATGPVGMVNLWHKGPINMGKMMGQWITYVLVISIIVAYVTGRTVGVGAPFLVVFRVAGTVASLAYASAIVPSAIWWGRPWNVTWKEVADGVVYGLLTGASFGWLFPR
jgi:hypothetical protein